MKPLLVRTYKGIGVLIAITNEPETQDNGKQWNENYFWVVTAGGQLEKHYKHNVSVVGAVPDDWTVDWLYEQASK